MVPFDTWSLFAVASVALAITPGPNPVFLVSRTLVQGRVAGLVSLAARLVFDTRG
jgi:threonine/homoserine/homoserine lactone efflux protein